MIPRRLRSACLGICGRLGPVLLVLAGCIFAVTPLGYPGYIQPLQGFQPIYALYSWEAEGCPLAWRPMQPHWAPLSGDGPLYLWLARGFRLMGLPGPAAVRAVFLVSQLLGAIGAYALCALAGQKGVRVPLALVWAYAPACLWAVYGLGAPGVSLALGFAPWLALALARGAKVPVAIGIGLLAAAAQPGLALLATVVLGLAVFVLRRTRPSAWPLVGAIVSVAFVLWASGFGGLAPRRPLPPQFARLDGLLVLASPFAPANSPWQAYGDAGPGVGVLLLFLFVWPVCSQPRSLVRGRALGVLLVTGCCVALALPWAAPLWSVLQVFVVAPWLFLALGNLVLFWAGVELGGQVLGKRSKLSGLVLALGAAILAWPFLLPPVTAVVPAARPMGSFADGRILLVRAELHGPLRHGAAPRLRLYWQSTEPLSEDYSVFVHVVDEAGQRWGQHDSFPANGAAPTSSWRPGAVIVDDHPLLIDPRGPRAGYRLLVGLYRWQDGSRLPLDGGGTALELASG